MDAGKYGGYRDHEFRDHEADLRMTRKELGYSNGEYEQVRNGSRDNSRGHSQGKANLEYGGRVRQRDIRDREMKNSGNHTISSRSDSGSSVGALEGVATRFNPWIENLGSCLVMGLMVLSILKLNLKILKLSYLFKIKRGSSLQLFGTEMIGKLLV